jgi:hypothetical protein
MELVVVDETDLRVEGQIPKLRLTQKLAVTHVPPANTNAVNGLILFIIFYHIFY